MSLVKQTPMINRLKRYLNTSAVPKATNHLNESNLYNKLADLFDQLNQNVLVKKHELNEDLTEYKKALSHVLSQYHAGLLKEHLTLLQTQIPRQSIYVPIIIHQDETQHIQSAIECIINEGLISIRVPISYQYDTAILIGRVFKLIQLKNIVAYSEYGESEFERHPLQLGEELILDGFNTLKHHIHELEEHSLIYIPRSFEYLHNSVCEISLLDLSAAYESNH